MSKRIYLKDGNSIKVEDRDRIIFKEGWIHIEISYGWNRYFLEKSIPSSNIKIIEEE